jgi:hypothetical protein
MWAAAFGPELTFVNGAVNGCMEPKVPNAARCINARSFARMKM